MCRYRPAAMLLRAMARFRAAGSGRPGRDAPVPVPHRTRHQGGTACPGAGGWQRNSGAEDVIGIIVSLCFDEPSGVGTKAFHGTVRVAPSEKVRISTRKRRRAEGRKSGSSPLFMSLFLELVGPVSERCENLDKHMVAAKAEGRRLHWYARERAPELVGEDGTAGRYGSRHRLDKDDAAAVEHREPARLHERPLSMSEIRIEHGQRRPVGLHVHGAGEQRSKLAKRRDPRFTVLRQTAPRRHDHDHGSAVRADDASELRRQFFGRGSADIGASFENRFGLSERVDEHA